MVDNHHNDEAMKTPSTTTGTASRKPRATLLETKSKPESREEDPEHTPQKHMGVLGKRKAAYNDGAGAQEAIRRHFEARFQPLASSERRRGGYGDEEGQPGVDEDSGRARGEAGGDDGDDDEWEGLRDDEDAPSGVEVVDHSSPQARPPSVAMSRREFKAFMVRCGSSRPLPSCLAPGLGRLANGASTQSSRPPSPSSAVPRPAPSHIAATSAPLPEDAPSLLAQDLELRRLLAESHLLSHHPVSAPSSASAIGEPATPFKPFTAGRIRHKATDLRLRALGAKSSILAQKSMPMKMRKAIVAAAAARDVKRRHEAKANGVILERPVAAVTNPSATKRKRAPGNRPVDRPGIGRLKGAELRLTQRDVKNIEGGRDVFGRRRAQGSS